MLEEILTKEFYQVQNFGYGNFIFKVSERTYSLAVESEVLFRFKQQESFSMTEVWFDESEKLEPFMVQRLKSILVALV